MKMNKLAIYCGSSKGFNPTYSDQVKLLSKELVLQEIEIVYGAGNVGLMGVLANEALSLGGKVHGVIPQFLMDMEVGHNGLTSLQVVKDMHIRKQVMVNMSEGFIAMPGGYGTFDEIFEVLTWGQLNLHLFPVGFYNINGYYDKLFEFLKHSVDQGFIKSMYLESIVVSDNPKKLISAMKNKIEQDKMTGGKWL